ncbi:MAG: hypothetical protein QXL43_02810, partial [Methanolinea sp.]
MRPSNRDVSIPVIAVVLLVLAVMPTSAVTVPSVDVSGLPLVFIQNEGQVDGSVLYHANTPTHAIAFLQDSVVCTVGEKEDPPSAVTIALEGQSPAAVVAGEERLGGTANFLVGNDPARWVRNAPTYARVAYRNVLPGVDIVYYGTQGVLKRDIVLAPGVDPAAIRFRYSGQESLSVDMAGDLVIATPAGTIREAAPACYQERGGVKIPVPCRYVLSGDSVRGQIPRMDRHIADAGACFCRRVGEYDAG